MKGKVIESYLDDAKPITIYIGEKILKLIEKYGYEDFISIAIEEVMHIPFYMIMTKYGDEYDYYEKEDIPVKVYVKKNMLKPLKIHQRK